jgi:hypothetical protein
MPTSASQRSFLASMSSLQSSTIARSRPSLWVKRPLEVGESLL